MQTVISALQRISWEWGVRAFGKEHMLDRRVRALRFAEEAVELAQCLDVEKETMHRLIDSVYEREIGSVDQEIGGTMVTLSVLCELLGYDMQTAFEREVLRVLAKPPEHFARRNQQKIEGGLA